MATGRTAPRRDRDREHKEWRRELREHQERASPTRDAGSAGLALDADRNAERRRRVLEGERVAGTTRARGDHRPEQALVQELCFAPAPHAPARDRHAAHTLIARAVAVLVLDDPTRQLDVEHDQFGVATAEPPEVVVVVDGVEAARALGVGCRVRLAQLTRCVRRSRVRRAVGLEERGKERDAVAAGARAGRTSAP